jgi:hypothetical protein
MVVTEVVGVMRGDGGDGGDKLVVVTEVVVWW